MLIRYTLKTILFHCTPIVYYKHLYHLFCKNRLIISNFYLSKQENIHTFATDSMTSCQLYC